MLIWHQAKVETLTFPCETLRDALGKHAQGGAGRLGLQLTAANKAGWPYTHVLVVDSFVPDIGSPTVTAVRETVKEIISASVQCHVKCVVLCVLPDKKASVDVQSRRQIPSETERRVSQNGEITTIDSDMEADPSSSARARLQGLMGLTLHSNDFSGFDDTTEVLVHHCPQPPVTNRLSERLQTTAKAP